MAYAFRDMTCSIIGLVGGSINLAVDAGVAEEGLSFVFNEDKNTMSIGADGSGMHTLNAGSGGVVTVNLLKTSPTNALLDAMYNAQRLNSAGWGRNIITGRHTVLGDTILCTGVAFKKHPDVTYNKAGPMMAWTFDAIRIDTVLGNGG